MARKGETKQKEVGNKGTGKRAFLPMAHMADVVDAPGGNENNSLMPVNRSRKGFLSSRNNMQKGK